MHRFYLPSSLCTDAVLTLSGREAHHGLHVLRLRRGEQATILDGAGGEYLCEVSELDRERIRLTVQRKELTPPLPYAITLVQAIPKGKVIESIVQKATELGVSRIVPLISERVVSQLDEERSEKKSEHWRQIAIEAIKQCGSTWLPQIDVPTKLNAFLARKEQFDLSLIASLQEDRAQPREWFHSFQVKHRRLPATIALWVGPEGDFTPSEVEAVRAAGALPITLGKLVLRSDTAAICSLSIVNYEMQFATR
jgi:16S rRNA (uracil1498-N3)-methyltransferase